LDFIAIFFNYPRLASEICFEPLPIYDICVILSIPISCSCLLLRVTILHQEIQIQEIPNQFITPIC